MKVLHLIRSYLPPSQVWLYNLLKNTTSIEHHIATRKLLNQDFKDKAFRFTISKQGELIDHILSLPAGLAGKVKRLLCYPKQWTTPREGEELIAYIAQQNIKLVHVHFAPYACDHLAWLQKLPVPFIVSFYGYDYEKAPFDKPRYQQVYQVLFQQAAAILCEGPHGIEVLEKLGCPSDKLHHVPLGIDLDRYKVFHPRKKDTGELKLLQIADFTPKKGQLDTIEAAIIAKQKVPKLELTLVGGARDDIYFAACQQKIKEANATAWIRYIPFVTYEKLDALLLTHHVFIHPSRYTSDRDCEGGAPTILFNAQAAGMPVISTRHCDIPWLVKDKFSGCLTEEQNILELAKSIIYFYEMPSTTFEEWQRNTYRWGHEVGDVKHGALTLAQLYEQVGG